MSKDKKTTHRMTVHYATAEDYKRMNYSVIGTLHRAETLIARRDGAGRGLSVNVEPDLAGIPGAQGTQRARSNTSTSRAS